MTKKEAFSERLRRAVRESGMTRYAISKQSGIYESALSRFIVGGGGLAMHNLDRLVEVLELELATKRSQKRTKKKG